MKRCGILLLKGFMLLGGANKMKKVLIIALPSHSVRKPEENCGIACLSAYLKGCNIDVDILDAYATGKDIEYCKRFVLEWVKRNNNKELLFCISPFVTGYDYLVELGEFIKANINNAHINLGGHFASLNKEYLLKTHEWIDSIIVGEGELSLKDLALSESNQNIKGVFARGKEKEFLSRERILNLDVLPFQDRYLDKHLLENQPYSIYTSRGCYGNCSFCSIASFYSFNDCKIRQTCRCADSVYKEIVYLKTRYNATSFKIVDDNFFRNNTNDFLRELAKKLNGQGVSFRLSARPNDITQERARLLKKMGATIVGIGTESTDSESLKLFNKGIDINYSVRAIKYLNDEDITCLINFIMFNPIIDINGLESNLKFISENIEKSVFHRINSHLWVRSTDPIVDKLVGLGVCERVGFPYLKSWYKYRYVEEIKQLFDLWCDSNMVEFYKYADVLMVCGIKGNSEIFEKYKNLMYKDVEVLSHLIALQKSGQLQNDGIKYIQSLLDKEKCLVKE